LNTATCLQATTTPTTTVPTASLFWLLDGSNSPTGNFIPAVNGTQSIGTSGSRWNVVANTLDVSGASTLGNTTLGTANTLNVNNIKQQAGASFVLSDPLGPAHIFISSSSPYTNTFINGNGAGVVFLGSAAKTSVADTTGNIVTAGSIALQNTSQLLPGTIANDTLGGFLFTTNAGKGWQIANSTGQLQGFAGVTILLQGSSSGGVTLQVPAAAGSNTLTFPAATGALARTSGDTFTSTTLTAPVINGTPTGTGIPTLTLKKGTGAGNYTSTSLTAVQVDGTNLALTVTIPTGWKLSVQASGSIGSNTAAVTVAVSITDGGTKLQEVSALGPVAAGLIPFSLSTIITGDGASHTIDLRFFTTNAADAVAILNASSTQLPTMVFNLSPSN